MPREERKETQKRATGRIPLELKCLTCRGVDYFEATIRNACENGIYIECDCCMRAGEKIRIHLLEAATGEFGCGEVNDSTGVIRWCRALSAARGRRYGAGIRFS